MKLLRISEWLLKEFPQNFIIRKPYAGSIIVWLFVFSFALIYKPLGSHPAQYLSYEATMAIYSLISAASLIGWIWLLKAIPWYGKANDWNFLKEITAILLLLSGVGVVVYFLAFAIEEPAERWNIPTFLDSMVNAFLVGVIPFLFFTGMNLRFLFMDEKEIQIPGKNENESGQLIHINSQLKKEELKFFPNQFIYAESESNYVNFYILKEGKIFKHMIRNSISNVEEQLSAIPFLIRTHRAFIVNLKKVRTKKGNTLGYRLRLDGVDKEIPVSRNNTHHFNDLLGKFM
jgi:hypothetical protein